MSDQQIIKNRRSFEIAGAVLCGLISGYVLWNLSLPSDEVATTTDYLVLILYLISSVGCYVGSFFLLNRYYIVPAENLSLRWIYICMSGTAIICLLDSPRQFLKDSPQNLTNFITSSLTILLILTGLTLSVMAVVVSAGVIVGRTRKMAGKQRLTDTHGI